MHIFCPNIQQLHKRLIVTAIESFEWKIVFTIAKIHKSNPQAYLTKIYHISLSNFQYNSRMHLVHLEDKNFSFGNWDISLRFYILTFYFSCSIQFILFSKFQTFIFKFELSIIQFMIFKYSQQFMFCIVCVFLCILLYYREGTNKHIYLLSQSPCIWSW